MFTIESKNVIQVGEYQQYIQNHVPVYFLDIDDGKFPELNNKRDQLLKVFTSTPDLVAYNSYKELGIRNIADTIHYLIILGWYKEFTNNQPSDFRVPWSADKGLHFIIHDYAILSQVERILGFKLQHKAFWGGLPTKAEINKHFVALDFCCHRLLGVAAGTVFADSDPVCVGDN